jgi:hypothetical protein
VEGWCRCCGARRSGRRSCCPFERARYGGAAPAKHRPRPPVFAGGDTAAVASRPPALSAHVQQGLRLVLVASRQSSVVSLLRRGRAVGPRSRAAPSLLGTKTTAPDTFLLTTVSTLFDRQTPGKKLGLRSQAPDCTALQSDNVWNRQRSCAAPARCRTFSPTARPGTAPSCTALGRCGTY